MTNRTTTPADRIALAAALTTVAMWSSAFVGIRAAGVDFSPGPIAFGRLAIGVLVLGGLVASRGWVHPSRRAVANIVGVALAWAAAYSVILNQAERLVDAGTAAILVGTGPIFIALLAGTFLGEGFPRRLLAGCAVAFTGTAIVGLTSSAGGGGTASTPLGIGLCLLAAILYGVGVTFQKPALRELPGLQVAWMACFIGAVALLPFAPTLLDELGRAPSGGTVWLLYLGIFPTSIGFTTWSLALSRMSAGRAGTISYLISPAAIGISWLLLGETPGWMAVAGGALCITGVVLARSTRRPTIARLRRGRSPGDRDELRVTDSAGLPTTRS